MPSTIVAAVLGLLLACTATGCGFQIAVYTEHSPEADFSGLSTWDWAPPRKGAESQKPEDPILDARLRAAISAQMTQQGFVHSSGDGAAPTFLVGYRAATEDAIQAWAIDDYYGYQRPTYRFYAGRSHSYPLGTGTQRQIVYEYQEGSLVLDVSLPETHELIWRAWARASLEHGESQETRDRRLREAVRKMLKGFPPR